jgi:hypothetical protein
MYFIGINVYFYFSYFRFLCACTHLTLKSPWQVLYCRI